MIKSLVLFATAATLVAAALCAVGTAGPAAATPSTATASAATASAPAMGQELGPLAELAQYVNATDAQRLQLKAKAIDMTKAMQEFMKANGPAWQQATADCAGSPDDPDKRKAAGEKVAQFQAQWDQLLAAHQAAVMNVLTPDQRLAWEEHCLTEAMTARVAGMQIRHDAGGQPVAQRGELTPRQTKMIEDACKATAKTIQGMTDPYDPARRQELITKLEADIRQKLQPAGIAPTTQPEGK